MADHLVAARRTDAETELEVRRSVSIPRELLREWIAILAYQKWRFAGCMHGCDLDHWLEAEQEILTRIGESLPSYGAPNNPNITTTAKLKIYSPDKEQDAPTNISRKEIGDNMALTTTNSIAAMTSRTAMPTDDRSQVVANRDPLTLISSSDRAQHVQRFAVIRRTGEHAGSILFSEPTLSAASAAAQALPGYRPQDYWVRFIPSDEV